MPGCREAGSSGVGTKVPGMLQLLCLPEFRTQEEGLIREKGRALVKMICKTGCAQVSRA